ncbi:MAG: AAA family ATPase, partial [candidate division Zixibacteria bacterium]|nr:AAA family ATPase [candidate division Zixibacteria bacterium]
MKIKEFWITRYGPLPNTGQVPLGDFNLFFGKNEDGKTLTIDALVKLLLGRHIKDFRLIDRVDEKPDGYVIIQHEDGKETKLPEKGDLTKIADLTSSECRNIFIIRNSDLS